MSTKPQMSHDDWKYLASLLDAEDSACESMHLEQDVPDHIVRFVDFMVDDTYDGAPYCSHCGPKSACTCPPHPAND